MGACVRRHQQRGARGDLRGFARAVSRAAERAQREGPADRRQIGGQRREDGMTPREKTDARGPVGTVRQVTDAGRTTPLFQTSWPLAVRLAATLQRRLPYPLSHPRVPGGSAGLLAAAATGAGPARAPVATVALTCLAHLAVVLRAARTLQPQVETLLGSYGAASTVALCDAFPGWYRLGTRWFASSPPAPLLAQFVADVRAQANACDGCQGGHGPLCRHRLCTP